MSSVVCLICGLYMNLAYRLLYHFVLHFCLVVIPSFLWPSTLILSSPFFWAVQFLLFSPTAGFVTQPSCLTALTWPYSRCAIVTNHFFPFSMQSVCNLSEKCYIPDHLYNSTPSLPFLLLLSFLFLPLSHRISLAAGPTQQGQCDTSWARGLQHRSRPINAVRKCFMNEMRFKAYHRSVFLKNHR